MIPGSSHDLRGYSLEMIAEILDRVIYISLNRDTVLSGKTPDIAKIRIWEFTSNAFCFIHINIPNWSRNRWLILIYDTITETPVVTRDKLVRSYELSHFIRKKKKKRFLITQLQLVQAGRNLLLLRFKLSRLSSWKKWCLWVIAAVRCIRILTFES